MRPSRARSSPAVIAGPQIRTQPRRVRPRSHATCAVNQHFGDRRPIVIGSLSLRVVTAYENCAFGAWMAAPSLKQTCHLSVAGHQHAVSDSVANAFKVSPTDTDTTEPNHSTCPFAYGRLLTMARPPLRSGPRDSVSFMSGFRASTRRPNYADIIAFLDAMPQTVPGLSTVTASARDMALMSRYRESEGSGWNPCQVKFPSWLALGLKS